MCVCVYVYVCTKIKQVEVLGFEGTAYSDSLQSGTKVTQQGPVVFDQEVDRIYLQSPDSVKVGG